MQSSSRCWEGEMPPAARVDFKMADDLSANVEKQNPGGGSSGPIIARMPNTIGTTSNGTCAVYADIATCTGQCGAARWSARTLQAPAAAETDGEHKK